MEHGLAWLWRGPGAQRLPQEPWELSSVFCKANTSQGAGGVFCQTPATSSPKTHSGCKRKNLNREEHL